MQKSGFQAGFLLKQPKNTIMRKLTMVLVLAAVVIFAATGTASAQTPQTPRIYIMMKDGKLTEVNNGKKEPVTKDIDLVNGSTIHPDGTINDKGGNVIRLQEGEYMTMDGRIRKLKDMGGGGKPATK
jgi:hypothetical protein